VIFKSYPTWSIGRDGIQINEGGRWFVLTLTSYILYIAIWLPWAKKFLRAWRCPDGRRGVEVAP
jgi:hypothetical protein